MIVRAKLQIGDRVGLVGQQVEKLVGVPVNGGPPNFDAIGIGMFFLLRAPVAGIPFLCAVSAPSDLAVEAADRLGVSRTSAT